MVVHGTDYDHRGIYSGVLDPSELNRGVPGTATAPALCGPLQAAHSAAADSRSRGGARIYTAVLQGSGAQGGVAPGSVAQGSVGQGSVGQGSVGPGLPDREIFFCHLEPALAALPQTRRTGTGGTA